VTGASTTLTSTDTAIVAIRAANELEAKTPGTVTVTAVVGGKSATASVTVIALTAIVPGPRESCAISAAGNLFCAGDLYGERAKLVSPQLKWLQLDANGDKSDRSTLCGVRSDGVVMCWGSNSNGQLGIGQSGDRDAPQIVSLPAPATMVSVGFSHVCALTSGGDIYCWGNGKFGQNGDALFADHSSPVAVVSAEKFKRLTAGSNHTCALSTGGRAYCWGNNELGQLGRGGWTATGLTNMTPVQGDLIFNSISARGATTCALTASGQDYCWGTNTVFELGRTSTELCRADGHPCSSVPGLVSGGITFSAIATDGFGGCGLSSATAYCWGLDIQSSLGVGTVPACNVSGALRGCTSAPLAGVTGLRSLVGGQTTYCGIEANGGAYCWGENSLGQLGFPGVTESEIPRVFSLDPGAVPP